MTPIEEISAVLRGMTQAHRRAVGERTGVPFDTVQKIALEQTKNPRIETFLKLRSGLERELKRFRKQVNPQQTSQLSAARTAATE